MAIMHGSLYASTAASTFPTHSIIATLIYWHSAQNVYLKLRNLWHFAFHYITAFTAGVHLLWSRVVLSCFSTGVGRASLWSNKEQSVERFSLNKDNAILVLYLFYYMIYKITSFRLQHRFISYYDLNIDKHCSRLILFRLISLWLLFVVLFSRVPYASWLIVNLSSLASLCVKDSFYFVNSPFEVKYTLQTLAAKNTHMQCLPFLNNFVTRKLSALLFFGNVLLEIITSS